jgi:hypothetical protein
LPIEPIHARDARLEAFHRPYLDLTTPIGAVSLLLSAMVEDERQRAEKQANDGSKAAGVWAARLSQKPKLNEHKRKHAIRRLAAGS